MPRKPQQQTLSVRIGDALRKRLERAREAVASTTGDFVSTSEIAKRMLESAREDRMEFVDLMADAEATLLQIRRKGQAGYPLSVAEWTVVAYYTYLGLETLSANIAYPVNRQSVVTVIDAFLAVYNLQGDRGSGEDERHLRHLTPDWHRLVGQSELARDNKITPAVVRRVAAEVRRLSDGPEATLMPVFVGRNLYRVLDETKAGAEAVNAALRPWWPTLWRLAARGHYAAAGKPVREPTVDWDWRQEVPMPSLTEPPFLLNFFRTQSQDLTLLLNFPRPFGPLYPISGYPVLAEFRAMLAVLPSARQRQNWDGRHWFGYAHPATAKEPGSVSFRAHANGVMFSFSEEHWAALQRLFHRAWELPEVQQMWDALSLEYGEQP
jgi:hypothetical protein